ncbi:hypothetical protein UK12_34580, partial [Saccharothrix sp. ST-888]
MPAAAGGGAPGHPQAAVEDRGRFAARAVRGTRVRAAPSAGPRARAEAGGREVIRRSADEVAGAIGGWATAAKAYELLTVDVPAAHWIAALTTARDVR